MSFVGFRVERPELHEQCMQDESLFTQRIRVSHWLTVVAQVYGGCDLPPADKVRYDPQYMRTVGPILDTRLMLMSVLNTVLRRWDRKEH